MAASGTYLLVGPPGTGKTTEVVRLVTERVTETRTPFCSVGRREPALVCSLTRAAAAEAAGEGRGMPLKPRQVGTIHSHAYAALGCPALVEDRIGDWNRKWPNWALSGDEGSDDPWTSGKSGDDLRQEYDRLRASGVGRDHWGLQVSEFAGEWERWKAEEELMDFSDLIEVAIADEVDPPGQARHLFMDEAQDASWMELELMRKWARKSDSLTLVGDPRQAIYVWRGAYPQMFADERLIRSNRRRVLAQSYRVPRAVHRVAERWVRRLSGWEDIEYRPADRDGSVSELSNASWMRIIPLVRLIEQELGRDRSVMVIGACGYMVSPLIKALREAAVPFANPWCRKRGDWNPMGGGRGISSRERVLALLVPPVEGRLWGWRELSAWAGVLQAKGVLQRGVKKMLGSVGTSQLGDPVFDEIADLFEEEALSRLWELAYMNPDWPGLMRWWREHVEPRRRRVASYVSRVAEKRGIEALKHEPRCYVGTIHSMKGAEAETVVVFPDLSFAGWKEWCSSAGRDSVVRLFYVALTRARQKLVLCAPAGNEHVPILRDARSK